VKLKLDLIVARFQAFATV